MRTQINTWNRMNKRGQFGFIPVHIATMASSQGKKEKIVICKRCGNKGYIAGWVFNKPCPICNPNNKRKLKGYGL